MSSREHRTSNSEAIRVAFSLTPTADESPPGAISHQSEGSSRIHPCRSIIDWLRGRAQPTQLPRSQLLRTVDKVNYCELDGSDDDTSDDSADKRSKLTHVHTGCRERRSHGASSSRASELVLPSVGLPNVMASGRARTECISKFMSADVTTPKSFSLPSSTSKQSSAPKPTPPSAVSVRSFETPLAAPLSGYSHQRVAGASPSDELAHPYTPCSQSQAGQQRLGFRVRRLGVERNDTCVTHSAAPSSCASNASFKRNDRQDPSTVARVCELGRMGYSGVKSLFHKPGSSGRSCNIDIAAPSPRVRSRSNRSDALQ